MELNTDCMALSVPIISTVPFRHMVSEKYEPRHLSQYIQYKAESIFHPLSHFNPNKGLAGIIVCHMLTNFTVTLTITANGCGFEPVSKTIECDVFHL